MMEPDVLRNVHLVADALRNGELVIFLGAGANRCDRPEGWEWTRDQDRELPDGGELSVHLTRTCYITGIPERELARVAQAVLLDLGGARLRRELRKVLQPNHRIPTLHQLLANLPKRLLAAGYPDVAEAHLRRLLFITTNYDDLLERALVDAGQPFHLLRYLVDPATRSTFLYRSPAGVEKPVPDYGTFADIVADTEGHFPVLLKFHGGLDRADPARDSFVITEDDYIEYVAKTALPNLLPDPVPAMLRDSHVLFLGHALRDWNLRVIFRQLWAERDTRFHWWAVQLDPDEFDIRFWRSKLVDIIDCSLREYVEHLEARLSELGISGDAP